MSQCTPPTFPFTSALPISFNRPGLFGKGEKSNAKYRGTYAQIFHRVGLGGGGGKLEGGEKKMQISGEPMQSNKDMHINFISQISIYIKHLYMFK